MLSKKTLAIGLFAAVGASSQFATAFDLDSLVETGSTFALETLDSGDTTTVGTDTRYDIENAANNLDVVSKIGIGIANAGKVYVRYDLTNGVFAAAPTLTISGIQGTIVQGGAAASSFVVFEATATAAVNVSATTTMAAAAYASTDTSASTSVQKVVYETLTLATSQGAALVTKPQAVGSAFFKLGSGLTATFTPAVTNNIADVNTTFSKFKTGAISTTLATLGTFTVVRTANMRSALDGAVLAANLGEMINTTTSTFVVTGDSFAITTQTFGLDSNANCATALGNLTANTAKTASTAVALSTLITKGNACYTVGATNATTQIPKGNHTLAITYVAAATTRISPPAAITGTIGTIAHDGTTVQLPYLTTFSDYNQRIVLVNRGTTAASYTVTAFQTEAGTTAASGTAASGTIPAGGSTIVKVTDVVTLTGGTRAAGTLSVVAPSTNIGVATTQVNLSDGATDTIKLL
jgi:hypothetical protein